MIIKTIKLKNYRNYKNLELDFDPEINLITGSNGVGKTNILEAIHMLSTTKSFRAKYDRDLINYGFDYAKVEALIEDISNNDSLELIVQLAATERTMHTSKKKVSINRVSKRLSDFSHFFKSVLFSPTDIDLITGTPASRRKYVDDMLFQVDSRYKKSSIEYQKALVRRNKLLEIINESGSGREQLPFWNSKMLEHGEYILNKRLEWEEHTNFYLKEQNNEYKEYAQNLRLEYIPNEINPKKLNDYQEKEIAAKRTLLGPHRDDFRLINNEKDMSQYASRGEQRTAVFLLKMSEFEYIKKSTQISPILLLDDIFSELDNTHREAILTYIEKNQTIITAASDKEIPELYVSKVIHLK